ncbi:hypothetical protein C8R48DRAFT_767931 [Suillus tomentosus]|nr:hypothetical protein C8R48DRAFT_767931 [Suillus tomentosus]
MSTSDNSSSDDLDLTTGVLGSHVSENSPTITWRDGHVTVLPAVYNESNINVCEEIDLSIIRFMAKFPISTPESKNAIHLPHDALLRKDILHAVGLGLSQNKPVVIRGDRRQERCEDLSEDYLGGTNRDARPGGHSPRAALQGTALSFAFFHQSFVSHALFFTCRAPQEQLHALRFSNLVQLTHSNHLAHKHLDRLRPHEATCSTSNSNSVQLIHSNFQPTRLVRATNTTQLPASNFNPHLVLFSKSNLLDQQLTDSNNLDQQLINYTATECQSKSNLLAHIDSNSTTAQSTSQLTHNKQVNSVQKHHSTTATQLTIAGGAST